MVYRQCKNYENLQRRIFPGVGEYGIPEIKPTPYEGSCKFIPFNFALTCKDRQNKGVHFFIDDYQFNRLWNDIDRYVDMLREFRYVMSPDFSTYTDFPKAIQIYNHYRKHWVEAYLQLYEILFWKGSHEQDSKREKRISCNTRNGKKVEKIHFFSRS